MKRTGRCKGISLILIALLLAGSVFRAAAADPAVSRGGRNFALAVGCDRFVTMPDTAPSSANNVKNMTELFALYAPGPVPPVSAVDRTNGAGQLETLIRGVFSDAAPEDTCYLYISTHGVAPWDNGGEAALVFSDGNSEERVTAAALKKILDQIPAKIVVLIDACYSGAMIGKGVEGNAVNLFAGDKYTLIVSGGGREESWIWSVGEDRYTGTGYFTSALRIALDAACRQNGDEEISLTALKHMLLELHGASTVRTYPEEDARAVFIKHDAPDREAPTLRSVSFDSGALDPWNPVQRFRFTVEKYTRLSYQLTPYRDGQWDFEHALHYYDVNAEGGVRGFVSPGVKERQLVLRAAREYGYALLQMITVTDGVPAMEVSHVVCVPPSSGDPGISVETGTDFSPEDGEELAVTVRHAFPCELTVSVLNEREETVRYLCVSEPSRPQHAEPEGSYFYWNGRLPDGTVAPAGRYRIRVRTETGGTRRECVSEPFRIR